MTFEIEVVYAGKESQKIIPLQVKKGTTVFEAIQQSKIFTFFPEIEIIDLENRVGIYGKAVKLDKLLKPNNRIEIYRDLLQDPKEARRKRAKSQLKLKKKIIRE
jgi:putative ubiquitin-RnfH superfamily antitoxin RatB of RatAB toxin-antitoxin module